MRGRNWLLITTALVVCSVSLPATAAIIDPELRALLNRREKVEIIPVLMVFAESPADTLDQLEVELYGDPPSKRRDGVIAALKRYSRKIQENVWRILADPNHPGTLAYADSLYVSNSIAFGGDVELILAVAAQKATNATLFYDKQYDMISALPKGGAASGDKRAVEDSVAWHVRHIKADQVWTERGFTGEGIIIGHLDTGVWLAHPDLRNHLWINPGEIPDNGLDDDGNGFVDDIHGWDFGDNDFDPNDDCLNSGHGTHTAGLVVGDGTGGIRTGVAPGAKLMVCKIFDGTGGGTLSSIWAAEQYCLENGARVITMSAGVRGPVPTAIARNDRFSALALRSAGVVLFNSAGNDRDTFDPPNELSLTARIPSPWIPQTDRYSSTGGVITVGGTGYRADTGYANGSRGPADWGDVDPWNDWSYIRGEGLIKPDLVAPAVGINSTLPPNLYSGETWTGTSMACPQAAATAALMLQKNPSLSPLDLDRILEQTAHDLGPWGKDNEFGSGIIDALAAVDSVNTTLLPNLEQDTFAADPDRGGIFAPGETTAVSFTVVNAGMVDATGVEGLLEVEGNPYVTVNADAHVSAFPDIAGGARGANLTALELVIQPGTPQGYPFTMILTVTSAEGFERSFDIAAQVGFPEYRTHNTGQVYLTVTSRGSLGYLTDSRFQGQGMAAAGETSVLFISSLWGGTSSNYMCNNDLTAKGADPAEWVVRQSPSGRVVEVPGSPQEQIFAAAFTDSGHADSRGVVVEQLSRAYTTPARADFVTVEFRIQNTGSSIISDYYTGLFVDWDVVDPLADDGGTDSSYRTVWVNAPGGPYYGLTMLGATPLSNLSLVDNVEYMYPDSHILDSVKLRFLKGDFSQSAADSLDDWASVAAAGPFTLPPGDTVVVAFALVHGDNKNDLLASAGEALAAYSRPVPVDEDGAQPAAVMHLAQNDPNPFNPATLIRFAVPTAGPVELAVYDLAGRRIRTLVQTQMAAGPQSIIWDGRDDRGAAAPSGLYVYRLTAAGTNLTRKMMLVR